MKLKTVAFSVAWPRLATDFTPEKVRKAVRCLRAKAANRVYVRFDIGTGQSRPVVKEHCEFSLRHEAAKKKLASKRTLFLGCSWYVLSTGKRRRHKHQAGEGKDMTDNPLLPDTVLSEEAEASKDAPGRGPANAPTEALPSWPALTFDADEFIQYVKDHELSDAEAFEFLAVVWVYVVTWVDLGFGIHPVQQTQKAREAKVREGAVRKDSAKLDHESALVVSCREAFNENTKDETAQRPKRRRVGKKDS